MMMSSESEATSPDAMRLESIRSIREAKLVIEVRVTPSAPRLWGPPSAIRMRRWREASWISSVIVQGARLELEREPVYEAVLVEGDRLVW